MAFPLFEVPPELETILLVEDEALVRVGLAEFLRENGYRVFDAGDAREALMILNSGPVIDLAIIDVLLPGDMDGLDLGRQIRAQWPDIKIVVTSGAVRSIDGRGDELGQGPVLIKPYSRRDFLYRVREALTQEKKAQG